ncbi:MAG: hypothetical protein ACI4RV_05160 [Eubacteriales bacterium]
MSDKGLFGDLFDFNHDGKMDSFEKAAEFATFMHIVNESEKEEKDVRRKSYELFLLRKAAESGI